MLIQLGSFLFDISTVAYNELNRVSSYKWAQHNIVDNYQGLQAVGFENDRVRLSGTFYPQVASMVDRPREGNKDFVELRNMAKQMKPYLIASADGNSLGYWVIEEIGTNDSLFGPGEGIPRKQIFSINLRYYGASL